MAFPDESALRGLLADLVAQSGFDIEAVTVNRAGAKSAVRIAVDADERPDLDRLEALSARISEALDAAEERGEVSFGPGYTLEVSTPGVDMPLTQPCHWRRNLGRRVVLPSGDKARILQVADVEGRCVVALLPAGSSSTEAVRWADLTDVPTASVEVEFSSVPVAEAALVGLPLSELPPTAP